MPIRDPAQSCVTVRQTRLTQDTSRLAARSDHALPFTNRSTEDIVEALQRRHKKYLSTVPEDQVCAWLAVVEPLATRRDGSAPGWGGSSRPHPLTRRPTLPLPPSVLRPPAEALDRARQDRRCSPQGWQCAYRSRRRPQQIRRRRTCARGAVPCSQLLVWKRERERGGKREKRYRTAFSLQLSTPTGTGGEEAGHERGL